MVNPLKPNEQEDFLRLVLNSTVEGFYSIDTEGRTTLCNNSFLRMLGFGSAEEVIGQKLHGVIHHHHPDGSDYPARDCPIHRAATAGVSAQVSGEFFFRKDGTAFPVEYRAEPIYQDGVLIGAVCSFFDISNRLAREKALAAASLAAGEASERIELALNSGAILATWVWDVVNDSVKGDERFAQTFSVPADLVAQGLPISVIVQAIHPDDLEGVMRIINEALESGGAFRAEYRLRHPQGGWRWIEANGRVELDGDNKAVRFPGVILDIDERKNAELALKKSHEQLRLAQDAGRIGVFSVDIASNIMTVTPEFCRIFGIEEQAQLSPKVFENIVIPDDSDIASNAERRVKGQAPLDVEYRIRHQRTQEVRWINRRAEFIRDAEGNPVQMVGLAQDITDRKKREAALEESEAQFKLVARAMPNQVWSADGNGAIDWVNDRFIDYSGLRFEDLAGANWVQMVHPDDLPMAAAAWRHSMQTGALYETQFRVRRHDGAFRWHIVRAVPVREKDTIIRWIGTNTDIEDQVRTTQAVNEERARLSLMVESAADYAIISLNKDGVISSWNMAAERIFQYAQDEAVGQLIGLTFSDEDRQAGVPQQELNIAAREGRAVDERWHRCKNGERFYASGTLAAMYDDNKQLSGFIKITRDMTEMRRTQEALIEARNAAEAANIAKTEFLATMSHEIRTPMNVVIGLSNILGASAPLTQKQRDYIQTLQHSADALLALINDLLDIAKIEARTVDLELMPFDFNQLVQEIISMMGVRAHEKGLSFTGDYTCIEGRSFRGDPTRLRQIVLNLCSNAVKFTDKGYIDITVRCSPSEKEGVENVSISVKDTGIGIAPEKQEMIFQKFVQADSSISREYGGTGLGLAITKTLVEIMGGTLELQSVVGEGSTFTICILLQVAQPSAPPVAIPLLPGEKKEQVLRQDKPRVLLVEDYAPNVLVATTFLEDFGYVWDVATNGIEAIELAKAGGYAVILMDVQMPGMNGLETTLLIRDHEKKIAAKPVPIIGMTAHALNGDRERCLGAGMDDYLSKPFNPDDLKAKIAHHVKSASA